jgi:hypothetical protein
MLKGDIKSKVSIYKEDFFRATEIDKLKEIKTNAIKEVSDLPYRGKFKDLSTTAIAIWEQPIQDYILHFENKDTNVVNQGKAQNAFGGLLKMIDEYYFDADEIRNGFLLYLQGKDDELRNTLNQLVWVSNENNGFQILNTSDDINFTTEQWDKIKFYWNGFNKLHF